MTNRKLFSAMLAIVLALGMAVAGCSKGAKGGGNAEAGGGGGGMPGLLKITGLPEQNWSVAVFGTNIDLSTITNISSIAETSIEAFGTRFSFGDPFSLTSYAGSLWTGTGKRQVVLVNQDHDKVNITDKNNPLARTATVNFSNGSATVNFSSFTAVTKN